MQKRIQGALFGASSPSADIHTWLRLYQEDSPKIDELITRTYTLDEINQGFDEEAVQSDPARHHLLRMSIRPKC